MAENFEIGDWLSVEKKEHFGDVTEEDTKEADIDGLCLWFKVNARLGSEFYEAHIWKATIEVCRWENVPHSSNSTVTANWLRFIPVLIDQHDSFIWLFQPVIVKT